MMTNTGYPIDLLERPPAQPGLRMTARITREEELDQLLPWLADQAGGAEYTVVWAVDDPEVWPDEQSVGVLARATVPTIVVERPVVLSAEAPRATLAFIRFLRDSLSFGLRVQWQGSADETIDLERLVHLPAPTEDPVDEPFEIWRQLYSFGRMYWRRGPGFVIIRDTRPTVIQARFVLDEAALCETFQRMQVPVRISDLAQDDALAEAAQTLLDEGIALRLDDWCVALPFRMRTWPIPYTSV
ncbi:MAG TPA: DUF5825 family protein [Herpetosiphonaceae bacterium]